MRFRLFIFLMVLVLTMVAGIIIILLVTGTFWTGISESKQLIESELKRGSNDISNQYGQLSVQVGKFSEELSQRIEATLAKEHISFSSLSENPEEIENLLSDLYESTYYSLLQSNCSGAFIILDTTVNPDLENSNYSKSGLYLKNMEPNIISSSSGSFTLLRGFPSIGRDNSIHLHTQWCMEFDIKDADYYNIPVEAAKDNKGLDFSKLYYWSDPITLPGTSEEIMLCSVPLMDSNNNIYGVCGLEISSMLFKLSHMPDSNVYNRMFCMLAPYQDSSIAINRSMFAGGYSMKEITKEDVNLQVKKSKSSFYTYECNGSIYLGFQSSIRLYPKGSPFSDESWITAVLVPKEDIVNSITLVNIIWVCLLSLLVAVGVVISIVFSNKYLKPLSQGIEAIKSAGSEDIPKTNVQELDDLIIYLADYKKELNQKLEQDKYQITLLEEFINKTKTLTPAERAVFNLSIKSMSSKEIADELFLSINTIKTHNKHIFSKLEIASREELLLYISMLKEIGLELN